MDLRIEIGKRIRTVRLSVRRRTQKEFAAQVGVSVQAISGYEVGDNLPSIEVAIRIARVGDVTLDWLLTGVITT